MTFKLRCVSKSSSAQSREGRSQFRMTSQCKGLEHEPVVLETQKEGECGGEVKQGQRGRHGPDGTAFYKQD